MCHCPIPHGVHYISCQTQAVQQQHILIPYVVWRCFNSNLKPCLFALQSKLQNRSVVNLASALFKLPSSDSGLVILALVYHFNYDALKES